MTPVLIDTRSWLKFGFIAVFFASVIFSAGFLLGYQNATTFYQSHNEADSNLNESREAKVIAEAESMARVFVDKVAEIENTKSKDVASGEVTRVPQKAAVQVFPQKTLSTTSNGLSAIPENIDEIKFSIQVGVYVGLSNAEKLVLQLKAENYDAYVSEYVNKDNEARYNVRLGYFVDKQSALPILYAFRKKKKSDAYIVKFSADSMILFAYEDSN